MPRKGSLYGVLSMASDEWIDKTRFIRHVGPHFSGKGLQDEKCVAGTAGHEFTSHLDCTLGADNCPETQQFPMRSTSGTSLEKASRVLVLQIERFKPASADDAHE